MKTVFATVIVFLLLFAPSLQAQELAYGFRVGLNLSSFSGPSEKNAAGDDVEEFRFGTGFHVGADLKFAFTDLIGIKTGLTFFQRGGEVRFDGDGFQYFLSDGGNRIRATGRRRAILTVTNSYLDVPLTAYYRLGEKLEFYAGGQVSFLVGSVGSGDLLFEGRSDLTNTAIDLESVLMDFNYFKDTPPKADDLANAPNATKFEADGQRISVPEALNAYYDFAEKDKSIYNILDVGLQAGVNVFINQGLYVGLGFNYGLLDATRDTYDVSRVNSDGLEYIARDDKDHNMVFTASLGFSF